MLAIVLVLGVAIPQALSLIWGQDILPPEDHELLLSKVNVPEDENGYFDLIKLSDIFSEEPKKAQIKIDIPDGINDLKYLESYDWDNAKIEELLERNKEALLIYETAAGKPQFQYNLSADPSEIVYAEPVVALTPWRQISRVSSIKAIYLLKRGKENEAFDEALKSVIIGDNIEKSSNILLITYLVGMSMKKTGLETMRLLASRAKSTEVLNYYQNELKKYPEINNGDPFRHEYIHYKIALTYLGNSENTFENMVLKNSFYYKPNETLKIAADFYQALIDQHNQPCSNKTQVTAEKPIMSWKLYFTENAVGKLLSSLAATALNNVRYKKCENEASINATRTIMAIRRYYLTTGDYPKNLDDLSSDYITELPNDPFNDKPFIMDTNNKTLISAGANNGKPVYSYSTSN